MEHKGTVPMETDRLRLRRFRIQDSQAAFRNWMHEDCVTKYLTWLTHESAAVTEETLKEWVEEYAKPNFYQWAIVLTLSNPNPNLSFCWQVWP